MCTLTTGVALLLDVILVLGALVLVTRETGVVHAHPLAAHAHKKLSAFGHLYLQCHKTA